METGKDSVQKTKRPSIQGSREAQKGNAISAELLEKAMKRLISHGLQILGESVVLRTKDEKNGKCRNQKHPLRS